MDLVGRGPNGRLDTMAACMLLWSGAVSFSVSDISWDGTSHSVREPTIRDDVVGMYRLRHDDVAASVPEMLAIMQALDADERLRVDSSRLAESVRCALPEGDLTGMGLFLLQGGTHPLVVEMTDDKTIRIRYDERLARGIPDLQQLLCGFALRLRALRGDTGDFTLLLSQRDATHTVAEIPDFEGCVDGASTQIDSRVTVKGEPVAEGPESLDADTGKGNNPQSSYLRQICRLEASAYTIRRLLVSTNRRVRELEEACAKAEQSMPDPNDDQYAAKKPTARGLPSSSKAARSLAIRSVIYIAFGVFLFLVGSQLALGSDKLLPQVMKPVEEAIAMAVDMLGLSSEEVPQIDASDATSMLGVPQESITNACRIVGLLLMSFAILIPVLRILGHKRRLDRELARTHSQRALLTALVEKQNNHIYVSYNMALEAWARDLEDMTREGNRAQETRRMLEDAQSSVLGALDAIYEGGPVPTSLRDLGAVCTMADFLDTGQCEEIAGEDGAAARFESEQARGKVSADPQKASPTQPTLRATVRAAEELVQSIDAEPSEKRRQTRISEYCEGVGTHLA